MTDHRGEYHDLIERALAGIQRDQWDAKYTALRAREELVRELVTALERATWERDMLRSADRRQRAALAAIFDGCDAAICAHEHRRGVHDWMRAPRQILVDVLKLAREGLRGNDGDE